MKISRKDPAEMAGAQINAEIERLVKADSELTHAFIEAGRGHERPSEYLLKDDELSRRARAIYDRRHQLRTEVHLRAGPNMDRLPRGFGPRKNPAKLERCVEKVKGKKGVRSAYAICTAATRNPAKGRLCPCGCNKPAKPRDPGYGQRMTIFGKSGYWRKACIERLRREAAKARKSNPGFQGPSNWYIHIQRYAGNRGIGPVMIYNGKSFSDRPDSRPYGFSSKTAAASMARRLLTNNRKLAPYKMWVAPALFGQATVDRAVNPKRRKNPSSPGLDEAAHKLEEFTGRPAGDVIESSPRSKDKTGLVIGELDLIGYRQAREGIDGGRMTRFAHKFRKNSRPLLAVSTDGKQLHIVGGQYEFTDAGIEDR